MLFNFLSESRLNDGTYEDKRKNENLHGINSSTDYIETAEYGKDISEEKDFTDIRHTKPNLNRNYHEPRHSLNSYRTSKNASCNNDNVDIAFLVDCTRSMRRHVLHTKKNIGSVVKHIRKIFNNHVRLAFVAYRDLTCPNNIQEMDFTKDISEFTSFADKNC